MEDNFKILLSTLVNIANLVNSREEYDAILSELNINLPHEAIQNISSPFIMAVQDLLEIQLILSKNAKEAITDQQKFHLIEKLIQSFLSLSRFSQDFINRISGMSEEDIIKVKRILFDIPLIKALRSNAKITCSLIDAFGLIKLKENRDSVDYSSEIKWTNFYEFLRNPLHTIRQGFLNDDNELDLNIVIKKLYNIFRSLGTNVEIISSNLEYEQNFTSIAKTKGYHFQISLQYLDIIVIRDEILNVDIRLKIFPFYEQNTGQICFGFNLGLSEKVSIPISGEYEINILNRGLGVGNCSILILPNFQIVSLDNISNSNDFGLGLAFKKENKDKQLTLIKGNSFELQAKAFGTKVEFVKSEARNELGLELLIDGLSLSNSSKDQDGFLQKILPQGGIKPEFDLVVGFSTIEGIYFKGSGILEVEIPIHKTFGPITIDSTNIGIELDRDLRFTVGSTFSVEIGPLNGKVKRMGIEFPISFENNEGNFGPLDIQAPRFKPPTGVGLTINSSGITGGGFLEFDNPNKQYNGILGLNFGEIGLVAIGLITTRMPDGRKGFSLLLNLGVTFDPPIQLAMGFTLSGVGGLLGVNRTMDLAVLQTGIRNKTLDSILFPNPDSVIKNADKIINDLKSVFPPQEGRFVIGPMVKIGYGAKNFITAEIGIFIELPNPIRLVLMGQIQASFPKKEDAVAVINLDVLGILNIEKKELSFQATLYDSSILKFILNGDSAFYFNWSNNPAFALSLGGFHPKFTPPPPAIIFADLKRLSLNISSGNEFSLSCSTYQALTPNSLQFGARVDLNAHVSGASVTGYLGFDTLIIFSPFSFEASISSGVSIKIKGRSLTDVNLNFILSGPTPWNARGKATIKILFFKATVRFNITWGRSNKATLEAKDPLLYLLEDLNESGHWSSALPYQQNMVEQLKEIVFSAPEGEKPILMHPTGTIEIRQRTVPFNVNIEQFGNAPTKVHDRFEIDGIYFNEIVEEIFEPIYMKEYFSRGQFGELSPQQKLSIPSFEKLDGGINLIPYSQINDLNGQVNSIAYIKLEGSIVREEASYESLIIAEDNTSDYKLNFGTIDWQKAKFLLKGNSTRNSFLSKNNNNRFLSNKALKTKVIEESYTIVNSETLKVFQVDERIRANNKNLSRLEAEQVLKEQLKLTPGEDLMVIADFEVAA